MRKLQQTSRLTVVMAALAGACGAAQAQDAAVAELTKPDSFVSIGAGYWSDDRPQQGIYDGMRDKGGYGLFDAYIARRDQATGTWFTLDARNLGLDTRELRADWLRQGNGGVFLEYSRTPRDNPYTFLTGVSGIGTSVQRVPAVANPARTEVELGSVRDMTQMGFNKYFGAGYELRVSFKNEDKSGTRQWGRGGAAEFAVEPLDSNTQQVEAALAYVGKNFQAQGGYYGSWYTNDIKLVDTALTTGANPYFLSQPLSNQAHQLFANGGYNFTPSTRGTFKVSYTSATQDETIPVGAGVPVFAGAPTNINGKVDTTLVQAGVTSRLSKDFSWLASLRYYDSDDKTPQVRVIQTNAACLTGSQCVDNTPVSYTTISGKLEGTYRLMQGLNLIGGIEAYSQDRTVPVGTPSGGTDLQRYVPWRTKLEETTYRLQLRRSLSSTVNGSIAYLHSTRDGSDYTLTNEAESDEINPIHIADRQRDRLRLMVDWAPAEALTLTFNAEGAVDEYSFNTARPYGLRDGTATNFSFDVAYAFSDQWQLTAWYARDNTKATQVGQRAPSGIALAGEKEAELEDIGDTLGAGLRGMLMPRLKVGADVLYVKNVNRYPETIVTAGPTYPAGITGPLADIKNELTRFKLYAIWALQKNSELRVDYIHELWKTDDWSWLFANGTTFTYGTTTDGTQVTQNPKQSADYVGMRYTYRFQ